MNTDRSGSAVAPTPVAAVEVGPPVVRRLTAIGCTLVAVALLLWNMPVPGLRGDYRDATRPVYDLARLHQNWALFAPEVSQSSLFFHLEVEHLDGSVTTIEFPDGEPFVGTYRAYRWSAYEEALFDETDLQENALDWALTQVDDPDSVAEVRLVVRESDVSVGDHGPFEPDYVRDVVARDEP
jgi:hypothetical protein